MAVQYAQQADLENLLTVPVVLALYDDGNGVVNTTALNAVLVRGSRLFEARALARAYSKIALPLSGPPFPELVVHGTLLFAIALSYERHPEYVRRYADKPMQEAMAFAEGIADAKDYLTDLLAQPKPGTAGGVVFNPNPYRTMVDSPDGTYNGGDL